MVTFRGDYDYKKVAEEDRRRQSYPFSYVEGEGRFGYCRGLMRARAEDTISIGPRSTKLFVRMDTSSDEGHSSLNGQSLSVHLFRMGRLKKVLLLTSVSYDSKSGVVTVDLDNDGWRSLPFGYYEATLSIETPKYWEPCGYMRWHKTHTPAQKVVGAETR